MGLARGKSPERLRFKADLKQVLPDAALLQEKSPERELVKMKPPGVQNIP